MEDALCLTATQFDPTQEPSMHGFKTSVLAVALAAFGATADAAVLSLTKLSGLTGGADAGTAVYSADLSGLGLTSILSIDITDASSGLGGATGQFSGFDLDAIKLSTTSCTTATCAASATSIGVFDFGAGTSFVAGTQRAPADPKLFGTEATGTDVNDAVATLGAFDAANSTITPFGFISMGDNGRLIFNLTASVSTAGLYLYIGEVGDNGEVAASSFVVRDTVTNVPLPSTLALFGAALVGIAGLRRRA
jgi:hypothetical protein